MTSKLKPIQFKRTIISGEKPTSLLESEIAINITDRKIFVGTNNGEVVSLNDVDITISETEPIRPTLGDLWYKLSFSTLYIYSLNGWVASNTAYVSSLPPTNATLGQFWFSPLNRSLLIWDGTEWASTTAALVQRFPSATTQNQIIPQNSSTVNLTLIKEGSQTANLLEARASSGDLLASLSANGQFDCTEIDCGSY